MQTFKYIILPATAISGHIELPILFPSVLQHVAVAHAFKQYGIPVAAGFSFLRHDEETDKLSAVCNGRSDSLDIVSRGREDAELVEILML